MEAELLRSLANAAAPAAAAPVAVNASLVAALLATLTASAARLVDPCLYPDDATADLLPQFDFVVAGGGAAGSAAAARLSEVAEWDVLLVEAGADPPLESEVPAARPLFHHSGLQWGYSSEPGQKGCRGFRDGRCRWPTPKVLGGTSSVDTLAYERGPPCAYDRWAASGSKGWSYDAVLPLFKRSEDFGDQQRWSAFLHGRGGPLPVNALPLTSNLSRAVLRAGSELGYPRLADVNVEFPYGAGAAHGMWANGTRVNAAKAFLGPIRTRGNLYVIKNALVTKIIIDPFTNKVMGVRFHKQGEIIPREIRVRKEVLVSAGAINTAQILMLSGVGPRGHLYSVGVAPVIADLPVGKNLHVIPFYPALVLSLEPQPREELFDATYDYLKSRHGPLATTDVESLTAFVHTDSFTGCPDGQIRFFYVPVKNFTLVRRYVELHGLPQEVESQLLRIVDSRDALFAQPMLLRSRSRGRVLLKSADPADAPRIYPGFFSDSGDLDAMTDIIERAARLSETSALRRLGARLEPVVPRACEGLVVPSRAFYRCAALALSAPTPWAAGTSRAGAAGDAVVDARLRVRGVRGLRVASVAAAPAAPAAAAAPAVLVGEKAAHMVREDWGREAPLL